MRQPSHFRTLARVGTLVFAAAAAAAVFSGDVLGGSRLTGTTEVVVTLRSPSLAAFGRTLQSTDHSAYRLRMRAAQDTLARRVQSTVPGATIRWRYSIVANGFAVVLPRSQLARTRSGAWGRSRLAERPVPLAAHSRRPRTDRRRQALGAELGDRRRRDEDRDHRRRAAGHPPVLQSVGLRLPRWIPEGSDAVHDAEGDRAAHVRTSVADVCECAAAVRPEGVVPRDPRRRDRRRQSQHHAAGTTISGVAPNAYLGNYKALTIPTPDFGLDGNSAEIAAAIDAAVSDGMDVINLSLGEPEIEPSRDLVVTAINRAAAAGVVPVIAAGNDFGDFGYGSVSSPGNAAGAITVAAISSNGVVADFSSAGPTPVSLAMKPDVAAPGVQILSSLPGSVRPAQRHQHGGTPHRRGGGAPARASPDLDGRAAEGRADRDRRSGAIDLGR